jgi:hypothetical protein
MTCSFVHFDLIDIFYYFVVEVVFQHISKYIFTHDYYY